VIAQEDFHCTEEFDRRCAGLLELALGHVPLYRTWRQFDPGPAAGLRQRFEALPVLTKADMRQSFPLGLMPDWQDLKQGLLREEIEYTFTSGTTSEKVVNIWNQDWWNLCEAASWQLNSTLAALPYPQRQAKLASSLNVGINCEEDLPMDHRVLGSTLYLNEKTSILQWQPRHLRRMAAELAAWQPPVLEANPSLLARLCFWAQDNGTALFCPRAIVLTFEYPSAIHLAAIRRAFPAAQVVSSYGSTEAGFVLEQCECGLLHQNTRFCRVDFVPVAARFGQPDLGRIFVSTFDNPWNVILRFDVGDLVRLHRGPCPCGRHEGITVRAVEGRISNVTFDPQGGLVTTRQVDDSLSAVPGIRDYHLEQRDKNHYFLQVVAGAKKTEKNFEKMLYNALESVYGIGGVFEIVVVEELLPGPAGKFRRTQADFSFDERGLFQ